MKFLTYMITSVAAIDIKVNPIEDGQPCGTGQKAVADAAGNCKSNKCNAVVKATADAAKATRRLAEVATPPTCQTAQTACFAIKEDTAASPEPVTAVAAEKKCNETASCKWMPAATGKPAGCEAECKCSGTTVVSVTVAFVAAILLL